MFLNRKRKFWIVAFEVVLFCFFGEIWVLLIGRNVEMIGLDLY